MESNAASEELIYRLRKMGLTLYEARAYLALLKVKAATSRRVAEEASIPQPRVYDVLRSLAEKGLIMESSGRPRLFRAVDPKIGLKKLFQKIKEEIEEDYEALLLPLSSIYSSSGVEDIDGLWRIDGMENIIEEVASVISESSYEVLISTYHSIIDKILPELKKSYEQGVSICLVLYDSVKPVTYADEQYYKRTLGNMIAISDRNKLVFSPPELAGGTPVFNIGYVTSNKNIIKMYTEYFLHNLTDLADEINVAYGVRVRDRSFVNLPRAIRMINSLLKKDLKPVVHVEGVFLKNGAKAEISGTPVETYYDVKAGIARITIRSDSTLYTIGGWGAYLEDIEASRIRIYVESS